ncbi:jerky-like protein [Trichonephila clavipes]|nr:jerky-like protein [Trichonephila clavipes]
MFGGLVAFAVDRWRHDYGARRKIARRKEKTTREAHEIALDRALYLWFLQRKSKGDPISDPLLCEKALELIEKLGGSADFKANTGWLKNLKSCHEIRELQIEGKSLSGDKNSAHKFKEIFLLHVAGECYSRDDVYNVDES